MTEEIYKDSQLSIEIHEHKEKPVEGFKKN